MEEKIHTKVVCWYLEAGGWKLWQLFPLDNKIATFFTFMEKLLNNLVIWMLCDSLVLFPLLSVTFVDERTFIIFQKMLFIYFTLYYSLLRQIIRRERWEDGVGVCITTSGNLCFRVFKLQLNAINKKFVICTVYESIKLIKIGFPLVNISSDSRFLNDGQMIKYQLQSARSNYL